jgi:4-amino-4-deoxy-L-arabinose transferase-like glycosyltransferase
MAIDRTGMEQAEVGVGVGSGACGRAWRDRALLLILGLLALRLAVNALSLNPVHFDEALYWAYGQHLSWGYYSKPPLLPAIIRLETDLFGDRLWAMRLVSPFAHALTAWLIFLTGRRLWDHRTGFWAAAGYAVAPGVTLSAMLATTDAPLVACWAAALYALVRALERGAWRWWIACGIAIGLGFQAKYTMLAFPASAFCALAFSPARRHWRGFLLALVAAFLVMLPNLAWNLSHSLATVGHVAADIGESRTHFRIAGLLGFLGAQLAVIGPPLFLALVAALVRIGRFRDDPGMRLMAWMTWVLLGVTIAVAFVNEANANWEGPAYVGGALMAARFLTTLRLRRWLVAQLALGALGMLLIYAAAIGYATRGTALPAFADPFLKTRIEPTFCDKVLPAMQAEGATVLLSNLRYQLSECMFYGRLGWDQVAIWNPRGDVRNQFELVDSLKPGDDRRILLALLDDGSGIARHFTESRQLASGTIRTHRNRAYHYEIWVVQGFQGY